MTIDADKCIQFIYAVEWLDTTTADFWLPLEEHVKDATPTLMLSVGFLIKETDESLSIARTIGGDNGYQTEGVMTIPKGMVNKVIKVPLTKRKK